MDILAPAAVRQGSRRPAAHALVHGPRSRAVRSLLEISQVQAELRDLLGDALARVRRRRDRPLTHLIEAALLANCDLGAEVDAAGMALCQLSALWREGGGA